IGQSVPLVANVAAEDGDSRAMIESMSDQISRLAKLGKLNLVESISATRGSARAVMPGAEIEVPLEGLIDFDKERERLLRELTKLKGEQDGLERRLGNADFVSRAAADVVVATRQRALEISSQLKRLSSMIDSL
ncbi:MAG: hypothetical protein ABI882_17570, partial [Acidobacteriota bacterium]